MTWYDDSEIEKDKKSIREVFSDCKIKIGDLQDTVSGKRMIHYNIQFSISGSEYTIEAAKFGENNYSAATPTAYLLTHKDATGCFFFTEIELCLQAVLTQIT